MKLKPLTVIDLFAGCGGFTAGFTYPPHQDNPWKVLAGIDFNHNAVETFSTNFGHGTGVHADLATIGPGQFLERLVPYQSGFVG